jgi:hypothetical protein
MTRLIGISGKPGSNKLVYGFRIIRELRARGQRTNQVFLSAPLYEELNSIAKRFKAGEDSSSLVDEFSLGVKGPELLELLSHELGEFHEMYGLSRRNEWVRKSLVLLGSSIRREQNPDYYLDRLNSQLEGLDFGVITDLRFPNEADYIRWHGGGNLRVEINNADDDSGGYKYQEGLSDPTETALDDYSFFNWLFYRNNFNGLVFGRELEDFFEIPVLQEKVR